MSPADYSIPQWPFAWGGPLGTGRIKSSPDDFIVEENLSFAPAGFGEHIFLQIEKSGETTDYVARALARYTGVHQRDVGYAGLKDRHARTLQWFSIRVPGKKEPDWSPFDMENVKIRRIVRHARKLRRGAIASNAFQIQVKDWDVSHSKTIERLNTIARHGFPNYFSAQRFGRNGQNVMKASVLLVEKKHIRREQRSLYLSAIRSYLFNQILAERIRRKNWNQLLQGEICQLHSSNSQFRAAHGDTALHNRMEIGDIHPTGLLCGDCMADSGGRAGQLEKRVVDRYPELLKILTEFRLRTDRRALRVYPQNLEWRFPYNNVLQLRFNLPSGSYATSLLREMMAIQYPPVSHPSVEMA